MQKIVRFLSSPPGVVLRYAVSLGLIAWLAGQLDWHQLAGLLPVIGWLPLLAALALALAAYPLCAWRWWLLLRATGVPLTWNRAHAVTWIGQFYNAFLPGGIGGDATRLLYAFHDHPERKAAAATATVTDRAAGFAVLVVLAALALFAAEAGGPGSELSNLGWLLAGAAAGLALLSWLTAVLVLPRLPGGWAEATLRLRQSPRILISATLLSAGVWLIDFASGWLIARSLGLAFDPLALAAALGLAYLSTLLPISLGGHGLREGSLVLALQWLGQTEGYGTDLLAAFALIFLTVSLVTSLVGGALLVVAGTSARRNAAAG